MVMWYQEPFKKIKGLAKYDNGSSIFAEDKNK